MSAPIPAARRKAQSSWPNASSPACPAIARRRRTSPGPPRPLPIHQLLTLNHQLPQQWRPNFTPRPSCRGYFLLAKVTLRKSAELRPRPALSRHSSERRRTGPCSPGPAISHFPLHSAFARCPLPIRPIRPIRRAASQPFQHAIASRSPLSQYARTMRCFYHAEKEAVALCMACARGICPECAAPIAHALACRGHCEERARSLLQVTDYNLQQVDKLLHPKVHLVTPAGQSHQAAYSADQVAAQLSRHVRQVQKSQRTWAALHFAAAVALLLLAILQATPLPAFLGVCFLAFGIVTLIQSRTNTLPKPPETQTK
jgi:hypothetical protein